MKGLFCMKNKFPEGDYDRKFFQGRHDDSPAHYHELIRHLTLNGYEIAGESVERTMVDEFVSRDPRKFLTEIQIPVAS